MQIQKIKVDELRLSEIVNEFSKGKFRIPRFQRNYVWDRPRVVKLLNSIYSEFPIGTFFFWEAPAEYAHLYRNIPELKIPDPADTETFNFILDGQQRITSLYVAIKGLVLTSQDYKQKEKKIDYSEISFDLDREEFTIKKPDNERFVSLSSILERDHLELFRSLTDERAKAFNKCYQTFSAYPLSVVYVRDQSLEKACIIFERINQGGVRLSLFDLVVASTWSNEFDLKEEVGELNKKFEMKGFGALDPEVYLQTLSILAKGQATRDAQLQLKKEEIHKYWQAVSKSIELTVDYLRENLGAKIYEFVPYRSMIPMISYVFANNKGRSFSKEIRQFVDEWYWKCAFSERYNTSTPGLMAEDKRNLFDPILSGKKVNIDFPVNITPENIRNVRIYRSTAVRNGIICLLADASPKHFKNGSEIVLDRAAFSDFNSSERHHIFPRAFLKKINKSSEENSIANFSLIPAELNIEISAKSPKDYFGRFKKFNSSFEKTLKTHLIPFDDSSAIWSNDYDSFLEQRSASILHQIEKKVGKITPLQEQLDEDSNQVLTTLENSLRAVIDGNLTDKFGSDYWKVGIPGDIQESVKSRIALHRRRYPDQDIQTTIDKLSFCDLDDYKKIVQVYWGIFEDEFVSSGDFDRNFIYLSDYRNAVKHAREMTSIEKKQGEAAVEWFMQKIQQASQKEDSEGQESI